MENTKVVTNMQKDKVVKLLKDSGCRITKQRLILLDIILKEECSSCKEIFYRATKLDRSIGAATVYRLINTLEDVGAISRKNMYKVACGTECCKERACTITFEDGRTIGLCGTEWNMVIQTGLKNCGYMSTGRVVSVEARGCDCEGNDYKRESVS